MKTKIKMVLASLIAGVSLVFLFSGFAGANHETETFDYLVGAHPVHGPIISMASNGDTIEIVGQGTLSIRPKSVSGGGTVVHKDENGNVVGTGTWKAVKLLSFVPWGTTEGFPENFEGGKAILQVILKNNETGQEFDGILRFECLIGDFPTAAEEGAKLWVRGGPNFREVVSGDTLFIRTD